MDGYGGGGESKGKNHKSLLGLFSDVLGTALAGGKELLVKMNASFGRPVAFFSAVIGTTSGSFPLIMSNFCRKRLDFFFLQIKMFFKLFFFNVEFYNQLLILFKVCVLNIFELECTLPGRKTKITCD